MTQPIENPQDFFGKASQQFFDSLAPEEKEIFKATTLAEQVLQEARLADEANKDRTCRKFADKLRPFVAGIEQYGSALDVLSNTNSTVLCPIWGGIRIILHLAREFGDYFNKIATMLEQIGYNLSRLKRYPRLYPDNVQLNQALVEVYRHIFKFCEQAWAAFGEGKKEKKKIGLRIAMKLIWKPFKLQFEDIQDSIAMYIDLIEKEASIAEKEEAHKERMKAEMERQTQASRWEKAEENNTHMEQHNKKVEFFLDEQNIRKVNEWLSPADVEANHAAASKLRHSDTGKWFLERPEFKRWLLDDDQTFLWLHAIPGAGKTVLSSTIINHLKQNAKSGNIALAYFYCDYKDPQKQCPTKTLATLLAMLGAQNENAFLDTMAFFEKQYKENPAYCPSFDELRNRLMLVTKFFPQTLIVIDALDECMERECLMLTLLALAETTSSCVKVLVTSRNEIDIYRTFSEMPSICIQKDNMSEDVERYITAEIKNRIQAKKLKLRDPNLEQEITATLVEKADGMFQWAKCQIHHLATMKSDKAIRAALLTLPKTLDDIYVRILEQLERECGENIEYVQKILRWLVKGVRTLALDELAEALSIDLEDEDCTTMDFDAVWTDPEDILELCGSLVTVSPDRTKVGLAHYSIKEFLVSPRTEKSLRKFYMGGTEVEAELAKTCLTYLCFEDFEDGAVLDPARFSQRLGKYHFLKYAAQSWGVHAREHGNGDGALLDLTLKLLRKGNKNFDAWRQVYHYRGNSRSSKSLEFQPLYYASFFGLPGAVKVLLAEADMDARTGNALHAAALEGHQEVVEILLEKCDVHSGCGKSGNALYAAASRGHGGIVELLLDKGADIEGRRGKHGTALLVAALEGHRSVVQLLLKRGAGASVVNKRYGTPLSAAAEKGHERTLRELLDHGADVNACGGWYGHPLVSAIVANNEKMVRLLIDNGAHVDAQGGKHQTALIAAAASGNLHITRMLVENAAEVNDYNDKTGDALHAAAQIGHVGIVTFLLDSGADVNAKGGKHRNALNAACVEGREEIVRVLLDHGADVNAHDPHYGNALQMAARYGHQHVVRILVEAGADMKAQVGVHRTALQAAAASDRADMVQLLVDLGYPSGDTSDMTGALVLAAFKGHKGVIRLLTRLGANINTHAMTRSQESWSPLQAASYEGNTEVVQLLLDLGADANLEGGRYNTALVAFLFSPISEEKDDLFEILLHAGADVNAMGDQDYQSPLAVAASMGYTKFVRVLLEKGAKVNESRRRLDHRKWFYETVLQEALSTGYGETMEVLIESGADINLTIFTDPNRGGFANALQTAAGRGHVELVRRLVELGANLENNSTGPRSIYRSALQAAAHCGHIDVVRVLIELGADVNTSGGVWGPAIVAASFNGDCDMINLLLDSGADINAYQTGKYGTAIQAAVSERHVDALQLLLDRGADINLRAPNSFWGYPLIAAVDNECDEDYLQRLIELGANVNAQNPGRHPYFTALQCAAHKYLMDHCCKLLDVGADVNACGGRLGTALATSYMGGYVDAIRLFRERGALLDLEGGWYKSTLSAAIHGSCVGLFYRLLRGGASPNSMCGVDGSALAASIYCRHPDDEWIIHTLLDSEGIEIDAVGGRLGTALITAAACGNQKWVEAMLERGADIKLHAGRFWTPVTAAIWARDYELVKLLVEKGAKVNTHNGRSGHFGSALQCAGYLARSDIIPFLIDQGADVNLKAGRYCTVLQAAALSGAEEVVGSLIEKGADVNAKGGRFGTALAAASISGCLEIVKLLIEKGADVNIEGGLYGNALQSAVINCHEDVAEFLMSNGAKPQGNDNWWKNAQRSKRRRSERLAVKLLGIKGEETDSRRGRRVGLGKAVIN